MKAVLGAALLMLLAPTAVLGDEPKELSQHLGKALGAFEAVASYQQQCDALDPDGTLRRKDVVAGWRHENDFADYQRVTDGMLGQFPELAAQFAPQREALAEQIAADLREAPEQCQDFGTLLADEQFDVERSVRRMVSLTRRLGIEIAAVPEIVPVTKTLEETEILPLATLSARLEAKMAEIGSREGAREMRSLREARGEHAEAWLEADGVQILFGRVTDEDEMREWRDDLQSRFEVSCRSFSEEAHEDRMAQSIGQNMVLVGTPRSVFDGTEGGSLTLERCSLFTVAETGRPFVEEDDQAGLMLRPLEFDEAFAGANAGIALGDVERVLYESSFDNRLDGFGNGYVDRNENIYVLLRDGSAYRHEWSFPFTDLNVERSRHREPERWFSWREADGEIELVTTSGEAIVVKDAKMLVPLGTQPIAAEYYYLQIGMGGTRQDKRYAFSEDGTVVYTRGGFVAGNVATSYIIVTGPDDAPTRARYRVEDFALVLEASGDTERHFLAMPQEADGALPDTLIIDGTAFWLDDD